LRFPPINRRSFIKRVAAAGTAVIAADSTLIEPNRPRIIRKEIALRRWPSRLDGFTIALLSDFHYDPYFSVHPIRSAVNTINELHPDLVALTGDFVSVP
jgi:predicted MPP superfamily phosphohydrolase